MNRIEIGPGQEFSLGGENFVITVPIKERRLSTSDAFTIAKNEPYIRFYEELASAFSPCIAETRSHLRHRGFELTPFAKLPSARCSFFQAPRLVQSSVRTTHAHGLNFLDL